MLKKVVGLMMGILLLMVSVSFAEETPASIQSMTELGEIQKKLDQGITIGKVYYTDGYGFSTSEFTTDDPDEIAQLWNAVNAIRVGEKVNESITDWYPQIVFCLTDGTRGGVRFEAKWLCIGGMENYEISNAEGFWSLTASLVEKHEAMAEGAVPAGWNADASADRKVATSIAAEFNPEALVSVAANAKITACDENTCAITLLVQERYIPDEILSLKVGDGIYTQGHEVTIRTISEKDGYLILNEGEQDEVYLFESVDMNYWIMDDNDNTWTEFAVVSVPVSEHLLFLDDIDPATGEALLTPTVHNKADFLAMMDATDDPGFDIRNVMVAFDEHGELALIRRYYVPWQ